MRGGAERRQCLRCTGTLRSSHPVSDPVRAECRRGARGARAGQLGVAVEPQAVGPVCCVLVGSVPVGARLPTRRARATRTGLGYGCRHRAHWTTRRRCLRCTEALRRSRPRSGPVQAERRRGARGARATAWRRAAGRGGRDETSAKEGRSRDAVMPTMKWALHGSRPEKHVMPQAAVATDAAEKTCAARRNTGNRHPPRPHPPSAFVRSSASLTRLTTTHDPTLPDHPARNQTPAPPEQPSAAQGASIPLAP